MQKPGGSRQSNWVFALHVHLVFGRPKGLPPASFVFNHPVIPKRALASGYRAFSRPSHWPATSACEVAVALMHVANSMLPADSRASLSAPPSACQWVCHRRRCACTRSRLFALCTTSRAATTTAATMRRRGCSGSRAEQRQRRPRREGEDAQVPPGALEGVPSDEGLGEDPASEDVCDQPG